MSALAPACPVPSEIRDLCGGKYMTTYKKIHKQLIGPGHVKFPLGPYNLKLWMEICDRASRKYDGADERRSIRQFRDRLVDETFRPQPSEPDTDTAAVTEATDALVAFLRDGIPSEVQAQIEAHESDIVSRVMSQVRTEFEAQLEQRVERVQDRMAVQHKVDMGRCQEFEEALAGLSKSVERTNSTLFSLRCAVEALEAKYEIDHGHGSLAPASDAHEGAVLHSVQPMGADPSTERPTS